MLDTVKGILKKAIFLICIFILFSVREEEQTCQGCDDLDRFGFRMCVCRMVCLGWWWCYLELVALYGWMVLQGGGGGYNASEGWTENIYERNCGSEMGRVI